MQLHASHQYGGKTGKAVFLFCVVFKKWKPRTPKYTYGWVEFFVGQEKYLVGHRVTAVECDMVGREQNMPFQDMPLGQKGCSELKAIEKKQIKVLCLLPFYLKKEDLNL